MSDSSHSWVAQPAGPHEYASGVRLMALSKKRKELTCNELAHGKQEADHGPSALSGGAYIGLTSAQGRPVALCYLAKSRVNWRRK